MIPDWAKNALANFLVPRGLLASQLDVTHVEVKLPDLPPGGEGFVIAHVSDLHIGAARHWVPHWVGEAGETVRRAHPDVVVNTGDFFWHEPPAAKARVYAARFLLLRPGMDTHDVNLAVLGNHDYYASPARRRALLDELDDLGVRVLTNEAACVPCGSGRLSFVGLTDEEESFSAGLEILQRSSRPRIALIHMPDLAEKIPSGAADLVLAGHTHGGQITLPYLEKYIVRRGCGSDYVEGFYTINDMPVYVSRGLGYTGYPIRFRARPEVTLIRLVR